MNTDTIVYLKDQTFIPDLIRVISGTGGCVVNFSNDESDASMSYMLRCKRKFDSSDSDFIIKAGESVQMRFPTTGRFEITNPCNGLMKVRVQLFQLWLFDSLIRANSHSLSHSLIHVYVTCACCILVYCRSRWTWSWTWTKNHNAVPHPDTQYHSS
jgi:hypothetical protein